MKIVIIGNSESALETKSGDFIDSCDQVIRLGNFVTEGYEEFVGTRTTIIGTTRSKLINIDLCDKLWLMEDLDDSLNQDLITQLNYNSDPVTRGSTMDTFRPSIGTRFLHKVVSEYDTGDIYVKGFDFLSTGWYWDPRHSYGVVSHPVTLERMYYNRLVGGKTISQI